MGARDASGYSGKFFFYIFYITNDLSLIVHISADEQAPRLAPEKRDFTATYTLGATMRQITYY